jgi:predicted nuclease of predicted toxin-antitoxin system
VDESVDFRIIKYLRVEDLSIYSIVENKPGISDIEVINIAKENEYFLLTEDSDFGEWVFAHGITGLSILFLRYDSKEINKIKNTLLSVIIKYNKDLYHKFVVITVKKIRIRKII